MTDSDFKYWAFLSYSHQDNLEKRPDAQEEHHLCWADWLRDALKTFSIPADFTGHVNARGEIVPERIDSIFQDDQERPEDAGLSANIREALEKSRCLLVICSPRSAKSFHVNEAVRYFKQLGRGNRILSIVIAGEPNASDGQKPGLSSDNECFVPAMRHPVKPDGTLDMARKERGFIFADARHGADKREVLAKDLRSAETELAIAKIQLIAGLIGVGFNGLFGREQKRSFTGYAEAQHQAREAQYQVQEARAQAQAAQNQLQALQNQAQETQRQLEEARSQVRETQNKVLEVQNLPRDVQSQIQEAQNQTLEAQKQVREAQFQLREFQEKARDTQSQLDEARNQAQVAEGKVLESQNQVREVQRQLEEARIIARDAQNKVLEVQNLPQDIQSQVQEAQKSVREAQSQLAEARNQAQTAESKGLELQNQVREARSQLEEAQRQVQEAQGKVLEIQNQSHDAENQLKEGRNQAREAESQITDARNQVRISESKVVEIQNQTRDAQNQIAEARSQAREAQSHVSALENKSRVAQRLTKVFAVMAVLALMAGGVALWQRKVANESLAKVVSGQIWEPDSAQGKLDPQQIQQALQRIGGDEQATNRLHCLDELADVISPERIPDALKASPVIVNDQQRSHFQKWLLVRQGGINPAAAMTMAGAIGGNVVNEEGVADSCAYFQLAVLDNWMKTDLPGALGWVRQLADGDSRQRVLAQIVPVLAANNPSNTLALLNDLKPAPSDWTYTQLFARWATNDPVQAIQQRQQTPDHDAGNMMLSTIMDAWMDNQPDAASNWLKSLPESEFRKQALVSGILGQARTDVPKAVALAESLLEGSWRDEMIAELFEGWAVTNLDAATAACQQLPDGQARKKAWDAVVSQRIVKDPASAAELVKDLPQGDFRQDAIARLCFRWAYTNAPAALAWAQSLPTDTERVAALNQVAIGWAHKEPQAATQFASQHPELSAHTLGEIAQWWAQSDLSSATNWLAGLTNDAARNAALSAMAAPWTQNDPKGMATYALGLPAGDARTQFLIAACRRLAISDLPGTVELLNQLSDAELRRSILEQAARGCDLAHMDQAAKYVAAMSAGDDQKAAIKGLISSWTPADPEAAVNWLCSFPENNPQAEQVQSIIKTWSNAEPAAVAKWLANLPAGTSNDVMVTAFLDGAVVKYAEFAGEWTKTVTDATKRQQFQMQVARQWMKSDPSAASKWIDGLDLPDEVKKSLKASSP